MKKVKSVPTTVTLSAEHYWRLKAAVLEAQQVEQAAKQAVEQARQAVELSLREASLPVGHYQMSDADFTVTKV